MEPELVTRARHYAIQSHERIDQRRKYSGQPYEVHLQAVAGIVADVTDDPETLAAAWLHDVVEDTPATIEDVLKEFGPAVAELVDALTDVSRPSDGNRKVRKAIDRAHLAKAPARAQTIKLADLIDNCDDVCRSDPRFGKVFVGEAEKLLPVLSAGDPRLMTRVRELILRWSKTLAQGASGSEESPNPQTGPHQKQILEVMLGKFSAKDLGRSISKPQHWKPSQMVRDTAPLIDVVKTLTRHHTCIVENDVGATMQITRDDFSGPLARMWLFGILTSIELDLKWHIRRTMDGQDWREILSPKRAEMITILMAERQRRHQPCDLVDCFQLGDLFSIVLRKSSQPGALGFKSRRTAKRVFGDLENLRNYLAHSQVIGDEQWPCIARLASHLNANREP